MACGLWLVVALGVGCAASPHRGDGPTVRDRLRVLRANEIAEDLRDVDHAVVARACAALGSMGDAASPQLAELERLLHDGEPSVRIAAVRALDALGTVGASRIVAAIERSFDDADPEYTIEASVVLARLTRDPVRGTLRIRHALRSESARIRALAAERLGEFGVAAAPFMSVLRDIATHDESELVRWSAVVAMARIETRHTPNEARLIEALRHADPRIQRLGAEGLAAMGVPGTRAPSELQQRLRTGPPDVRRAAALAIAKRDDIGLRMLAAELDAASPGVREEAVRGLGSMGSAAREAAPALIERLDDSSRRVRVAAVEALGRIGPAESIVSPLIDAVRTDPSLARVAQDAMVRSGALAVPGLLDALGDDDRDLAWVVANWLVEIGSPAREAILRRRPVEAPDARIAATRVRGLLSADPRSALAVMEFYVRSPVTRLRAEAITSAGSFGPEAASALPMLSSGLDDRESDVRLAAIEAVGRLASAGAPAVAALARRIESGAAAERLAALEAIAALGPFAEEAIPTLVAVLRDGNDDERAEAAHALAEIGPAALPAVAELIEVIRARQPGEAEAIRALGRIGPAAAAAEALVLERAADSSGPVRERALEAIASLDVEPERAVAILVEATRSDDLRVRRRAALTWLEIARAGGRREWVRGLELHEDRRIAAWARDVGAELDRDAASAVETPGAET